MERWEEFGIMLPQFEWKNICIKKPSFTNKNRQSQDERHLPEGILGQRPRGSKMILTLWLTHRFAFPLYTTRKAHSPLHSQPESPISQVQMPWESWETFNRDGLSLCLSFVLRTWSTGHPSVKCSCADSVQYAREQFVFWRQKKREQSELQRGFRVDSKYSQWRWVASECKYTSNMGDNLVPSPFQRLYKEYASQSRPRKHVSVCANTLQIVKTHLFQQITQQLQIIR